MNVRRLRGFLFGLAAVALAAPLCGEVTLGPIFGSHMVLQRDKPITVWGQASPGEEVRVSFVEETVGTAADATGSWRVKLGKQKAGGPFTMTASGKANVVELEDVLVGEVWLCSGQSNMEWPLKAAQDGEKEVSEAGYPGIRLFVVEKKVSETPQTSCTGQWAACSPETAPGFSAVGYFFGRMLHKELDVPVGLIESAWGGTPAESWTSPATLSETPALRPILQNFEAAMAKYPEAKAKYEQDMAAWQQAAEQAKAQGQPEPKRPYPPMGPDHPNRPSSLYNGMIVPVAPYALRGAIWYQGESNAGRATQYRTLFPAMIQDWRKLWGEDDFPFYFVQLANFLERKEEPQVDSSWAALREAQLMTLSLKNTGMAVIIDIGEAHDIHPKNKQDVGKRLALNALVETYGKKMPYSGPIFDKMKIEGNCARIHFKHTDGGLVAKGGEPLKGFIIAGEDKKFVWAAARIEGDTVVVSSEEVAKPAAVRYAWADNPDCNLFNGADLPASPFRTDVE